MVTLEKITPSLFSNLYDTFLSTDDPLSDEQDWRNVFDYQWENAEGHCGYALLDEGKVVGMLGMIFSERYIDGKVRKFCNLHTWWVREDHRGRSLSLLRPALKLDGYTLTDFTPTDTVRAISKKLGFQDLDSQLKILLPAWNFERIRPAPGAVLSCDESVIEGKLSEWDKKVLLDHRPYGCGHLLFGDEEKHCYLLYTKVVRHRLPYCHIHYISNKDVFSQNEASIRAFLLKKHQVRFIAVDARRVTDIQFPWSFDFWAPASALFKSSDVRPDQVDNLYSEVVFLKLTVLPDITHELRKRTRNWWLLSRNSRKTVV